MNYIDCLGLMHKVAYTGYSFRQEGGFGYGRRGGKMSIRNSSIPRNPGSANFQGRQEASRRYWSLPPAGRIPKAQDVPQTAPQQPVSYTDNTLAINAQMSKDLQGVAKSDAAKRQEIRNYYRDRSRLSSPFDPNKNSYAQWKADNPGVTYGNPERYGQKAAEFPGMPPQTAQASSAPAQPVAPAAKAPPAQKATTYAVDDNTYSQIYDARKKALSDFDRQHAGDYTPGTAARRKALNKHFLQYSRGTAKWDGADAAMAAFNGTSNAPAVAASAPAASGGSAGKGS